MSKLDNQGRLTIPCELTQKIDWSFPKELAICYNFESNLITICDSSDIVDKNVIAIRKADARGRFFLPKELINLLGIDKTSSFLISLKNKEFIIKDMGKTGT